MPDKFTQCYCTRLYLADFARKHPELAEGRSVDPLQAMLVFQQQESPQNDDIGIVALRVDGKVVTRWVGGDIDEFDTHTGFDLTDLTELRLAEASPVLERIAASDPAAVLNISVLLWNIYYGIMVNPEFIDAMKECGVTPDECFGWMDTACSVFDEYINARIRLPKEFFGISGKAYFRRLRDAKDRHWLARFECDDEGAGRKSKYCDTGAVAKDKQGWRTGTERLEFFAPAEPGEEFCQCAGFFCRSMETAWFSHVAVAAIGPAEIPAGPYFAVFGAGSVDGYGLAAGRGYPVLEAISENGREYLKVVNDNGEEIWIDRTKTVGGRREAQ